MFQVWRKLLTAPYVLLFIHFKMIGRVSRIKLWIPKPDLVDNFMSYNFVVARSVMSRQCCMPFSRIMSRHTLKMS